MNPASVEFLERPSRPVLGTLTLHHTRLINHLPLSVLNTPASLYPPCAAVLQAWSNARTPSVIPLPPTINHQDAVPSLAFGALQVSFSDCQSSLVCRH